MCVCIVLMSLWVVPSYALNDSPIGFNMGVLYGSSTVPTAPLTEIGYSGFQLPGEKTVIQWVGDSYYYGSPDNYAVARIRINRQDSSTLVDVGSYDVTFEGVFYRNYDDIYDVASVQYYITYTDGSTEGYYTSPDTSIQYYETNVTSGTLWRVSNLFEFEKPVQFIYIRIFWRLPEPDSSSDNFRMGYGTTSITIDSVTWLDKIISRILDTVNGIFQAVFNIVPNITNFFSNFINTVINFIRGDWALPSLDPLKENIEQYYEDEDNLFSQFSQHVDEFGNVLDNAEQRFGNARGILAVSNMLSSFIQKNSFLSMLLWFSLALGIISFILGTSWLVGKFTSQR